MAKKKHYYETREFRTVRAMLDYWAEKTPDNDIYQFRKGRGDEIEHVTFRQFYELTENLGSALHALGLGKTHVACVGENSFNWISAYITVLKSDSVFVPVDKDLPTADRLHVINESDSEILFFSATNEKWVREHKDEMPAVKYFIGFGLKEDDGNLLSYNKLIEKGSELDRAAYDALQSDPNELKLMVYTSGTTGIAKGVMLTEGNITNMLYYGLQITRIYDKGLSVLPYHHTYEAVTDIIGSMYFGSTLCINHSLKNVVKDLKLFQPSYIFIVPALAEFMYSSIMRNVRAQGKEKAFKGAVALSKGLRKVGVDLRPKLFKTVRDVFGGRMIKIVCGGAPIREELGKFFDDIGIYFVGGYGITECSPLISVNDEKSLTYDTVGHRLPCLEWRIDQPNEEGIGEICVKSPTVMLGYYKQPDKTAEVIVDGWFYTGDYGRLTKDDQLVITGRKKNIIVLNNGKNVYPEEIEGYIQQLEDVEEVVVRGIKNERGEEVSLMAEVFLAEGSTATEQDILREAQQALSHLAGYKNITQVLIRTEPFVKTSSKKIKRNA